MKTYSPLACGLLILAAPVLAQDRPSEALPVDADYPVVPLPERDANPAAATILAGTPILEVENAAAATRLRLNEDGGFVVEGGSGTGDIPASGAGTRLMWYPWKSAFRAGHVTGGQWNDANIGSGSVAMGYDAMASGPASTAIGRRTTASGWYSTAVGYYTTASGHNSTAMGLATTASGEASTAMGIGTTASGDNTTAMGHSTTAQARYSLVIGRDNVIAGSPTDWVSTDPLFVAGNGSYTTRSNALTLLKNGNMTIAGSLTENSDARLKEDITTFADGLSAVLTLSPVRYRFREGTNRPRDRQIGFLAQDVAEVLPELVREDADGYLSVSYAKLTPVLAAAVQEQQAQIEALHSENAELRQRLATLEAAVARLAALEAAVVRLADGGGVAPTR